MTVKRPENVVVVVIHSQIEVTRTGFQLISDSQLLCDGPFSRTLMGQAGCDLRAVVDIQTSIMAAKTVGH
jgi:hypothetical protein